MEFGLHQNKKESRISSTIKSRQKKQLNKVLKRSILVMFTRRRLWETLNGYLIYLS